MRTEITTPLSLILSLISCSEDYGFYNDVLMYSLAEMIGFELSITEIDFHARFLTAHDDYGEEDYMAIKRKLIAFKKKYIDNEHRS